MQSVPRLMAGQGAIIGVGAIGYPRSGKVPTLARWRSSGYQRSSPSAPLYDHRVIQGAESGFSSSTSKVCLLGEDGFYEGVFRSMGVPYEAVKYHRDVNDPFERSSNNVEKQQKVDRLVNAYRVRGHLIAHLDPLDWKAPYMHAELDPTNYGLTVWDLDREFLALGFAGRPACGWAKSFRSCGTPIAGPSASSTCTSWSRHKSGGSRSRRGGTNGARSR